jgi:hypothetical protein
LNQQRIGWGLIALGVIFGVIFQFSFGNFAYLVGILGLVAGSVILIQKAKQRPEEVTISKPVESGEVIQTDETK